MKQRISVLASLLVIVLFGMAAREASGCVADNNWPSASNVEAIRARSLAFTSDPRCFPVDERVMRGTLKEHFAAFPYLKIVNQVPNGVIYTNPKTPGETYVMVQVRSVQGNDILLGPMFVPGVESGSAEGLSKWIFRALQTPFDELRHYAALYSDHSNYDAAMFALYERRPGGEAVPIELIYSAKNVPNPQLLPESQNEAAGKKLRAGYGRGVVLVEGIKQLIKHPAWIGLLVVALIALALVPDRFRFLVLTSVVFIPPAFIFAFDPLLAADPGLPFLFRLLLCFCLLSIPLAAWGSIRDKYSPPAKPNEAEPGSKDGSVSHAVAIPFNAKFEWPKAIPKICPKCHGDTESHSEPHYCPYCGSNQVELQSPSLPPHCQACGSYFKTASESDGNFPGHIHYCVHCGFKLLA